MRIAVIGAGNVGRALGGNWAAKGCDVTYGVPRPDDPKHADLGSGRVLGVAEAAARARIILLATPWDVAEAACGAMGDMAGRILIDATNPLGMGAGGLALTLGFDTSGAERIAGWVPGAAVFKAFNQAGFGVMADPSRYAPRPVMFVAGDDAVAKPEVLDLVALAGFEAVDAGPLRAARLLEPFAMLWIDLAMMRGLGRDFAFAIARLQEAA